MSASSTPTFDNKIFLSSNSFLSTYINSTLAISTYKVGATSFNIKASNFRQDIGYLGFIKAGNKALVEKEGSRLIDLAR